MRFTFDVAGRVKAICRAKPRPCPACGRHAALHIFLRYVTPRVLSIPTVRLNARYAAVCPRCAAVMELDCRKGRLLEKNPGATVYTRELTVVPERERIPGTYSAGRRSAHSNI